MLTTDQGSWFNMPQDTICPVWFCHLWQGKIWYCGRLVTIICLEFKKVVCVCCKKMITKSTILDVVNIIDSVLTRFMKTLIHQLCIDSYTTTTCTNRSPSGLSLYIGFRIWDRTIVSKKYTHICIKITDAHILANLSLNYFVSHEAKHTQELGYLLIT